MANFPTFRDLNLQIFSARASGARGSVSGSVLMASAAKNVIFELMRLRHSVISHVFGAYQTSTANVVDEVRESRIETFANDAYE